MWGQFRMSEELPLFPLGMVLFPGCRVPLHIFEDRYKLMVTECLENHTEFVLILGSDDDFKQVGCAARVTDVINQFADGRLNIIIEGTDRVRLIERRDDKAYLSGIVERIEDEVDQPAATLIDETRALYTEALKLSIGWYRAQAQENESAGLLTYTIASTLGMPVDRQQILLEQTSITGRFRLLREMLERTLGGLREHARKIGGNGKVHRGTT